MHMITRTWVTVQFELKFRGLDFVGWGLEYALRLVN